MSSKFTITCPSCKWQGPWESAGFKYIKISKSCIEIYCPKCDRVEAIKVIER